MPIKNINRALEAENIIIQTNGRELFSSAGRGSNIGAAMSLGDKDKRSIDSVVRKTNLSKGNRHITTNQPVDWQSLHVKLNELGLQESISNNSRLISQALKVPFEMYKSYKENTSYNNGENAPISFVQNVIQPIADDIANTYTKALGVEEGVIKASFKHLPMMQSKELNKADVSLKIATAYEKLINAGVSDNEAREITGFSDEK